MCLGGDGGLGKYGLGVGFGPRVVLWTNENTRGVVKVMVVIREHCALLRDVQAIKQAAKHVA